MSKDLDQFDPVNFLLAYDTGSLGPEQIASGFQRLIDNGDVWRLEGRYGKAAQAMIDRGECTAAPTHAATAGNANDLDPYVSVSRNAIRQVGADEYRVVLYGAYNAMGLVGSECNGILILAEPKKAVVTDEIAIESTGYFGPSKAQVEMFDKLMTCPDAEFHAIVNASPNLRFRVQDAALPKPRGPHA